MPEPHEIRAESQRKEYSAFVATEVIWLNGARAFNVGDPVPASHVSRGVVHEDQVAKTTTKAGQAAVASNQEG